MRIQLHTNVDGSDVSFTVNCRDLTNIVYHISFGSIKKFPQEVVMNSCYRSWVHYINFFANHIFSFESKHSIDLLIGVHNSAYFLSLERYDNNRRGSIFTENNVLRACVAIEAYFLSLIDQH